jgi:hypothetical protein
MWKFQTKKSVDILLDIFRQFGTSVLAQVMIIFNLILQNLESHNPKKLPQNILQNIFILQLLK